jgi:hypothetical protein
MMRIAAITLILSVSVRVWPVHAAFDLRPLPPAQRGAASGAPAAVADGPSRRPSHGHSGGFRLLAARVYGFRPFGLGDGEFIATSINLGIGRRLDLSVSSQILGVISYREHVLRLALGWRTGHLRFEPSLRFGTVSYESAVIDKAVLLDFKFEAWPADVLVVVLHAGNPFGMGLIDSGEKCPTRVTVGLGYRVRDGLHFGAEIQKEGGFPTSVATGAEVRLAGRVLLRTGIRSEPREFSMGLGIRAGPFALDTSASLHPDLGITHEAGLTYRRE